jgi:hypothetical protein
MEDEPQVHRPAFKKKLADDLFILGEWGKKVGEHLKNNPHFAVSHQTFFTN